MVFRNEGGLRFTEAGSQWSFESKNVSHGISLCDLDNDGDQDVVVNCLNEPPLLYRNNATAPRVSVALRGARGNTRGIGARIIVRGGPYEQSQEMIAGGRYLAGDEPLRSFAAGQAQSLSIEVAWPSGSRTVVTAAKPNYAYVIHEKNSQPKPPPLAKPPPMFIDASDWLNHEHSEHPADDFLRQPLLPRRLTESGPGVAFIDWDGDGRDELFFGNGAGGKLVGYSVAAEGRLAKLDEPAFNRPLAGDALGLGALGQGLLVAVSAHDSPTPTAPSLQLFRPGAAKPKVIKLPSANHSDAGSIAVADVDGDGHSDVFVAGHGIPGKFPQPASSWLLRGGPGGVKPDAEQSTVFANIGLVTAAVFVNLDDDILPELALATEWGPIRIFKNSGGKFTNATKAWGLDSQPGIWQTLAVGDFDNDGRFDLLAGNWGLNSPYKHGEKRVPYLVHSDIGGDGFYDALEARFDVASQRLLPRHQLVTLELLFPFCAKTSRPTANTLVRRFSKFSQLNWPGPSCSRRRTSPRCCCSIATGHLKPSRCRSRLNSRQSTARPWLTLTATETRTCSSAKTFLRCEWRITGWMPARVCCCSATGRAGSRACSGTAAASRFLASNEAALWAISTTTAAPTC